MSENQISYNEKNCFPVLSFLKGKSSLYPNLSLFFSHFHNKHEKVAQKMTWEISKHKVILNSVPNLKVYVWCSLVHSIWHLEQMFLTCFRWELSQHCQLVPHFLPPWYRRTCYLPSWCCLPLLNDSLGCICFLWSFFLLASIK